MPFASKRRHEIWTADVRYLDAVDEHLIGGRAYAISVMENHSRAILASAVTRSQDLASFLSVLYAAVERYGSPEVLVTDGGAIFRANQARTIYEARRLGEACGALDVDRWRSAGWVYRALGRPLL